MEDVSWTEKAYPKPTHPVALNSAYHMGLAGRDDPERRTAGRAIFEDGSVTVESQSKYEAYYLIDDAVLGQVFRVHLWGDKQSLYASCNCPFTETSPKLICEHKYAAFLFLVNATQPSWYGSRMPRWDERIAGLLEGSGPKSAPTRQLLIFNLERRYGDQWQIVPYGLHASTLNGVDLDDLDAVRRAIIDRGLEDEIKSITGRIDPARYINASDTAIWLAQAALLAGDGYNSRPIPIGRAVPALKDQLLFRGSYGTLKAPVYIDDERAEPLVEIARDRRALVVETKVLHCGKKLVVGPEDVVSDRPMWLLIEDWLVSVPRGGMLGESAFRGSVRVPAQEQTRFLNDYLPHFAERFTVDSDLIEWTDLDVDPVPRLYLSEEGGELVVEVRFGYGDVELPAEKPPISDSIRKLETGDSGKIPLSRIHRRAEREAECYASLPSLGLKRGPSYEKLLLKARLSPVDFLLHQVPKLVAAGFEIFGEENLASVRVNRSLPRLEFIVSSGIDWLDLNAVVSFGDQQVSLADLGSAIRKRERYVKLADGTIGAIPLEWIERYKHLFSFGEVTDEGLRLSNRHAMLVEEAIEHADAAKVDQEFERRRERLRGFSHIAEHPLPKGLKAELRPYQKAGFDWLHFLHEYEFGGCLADDMGVGKTVQTLAFLLSLKEATSPDPSSRGEEEAAAQMPNMRGDGHSSLENASLRTPPTGKVANLIVLPRSLIFNWEREAARFTPDLRVLVHAENKRAKDITHLDDYDLVLTTYGVMLRDVDILRKYRFHYVVLDEAQAIKNPLAQTGRAARMLQSDHRLVLTGTPVENSTIDLWSQFEFLNPGLLGSLEYFRQEFSAAIEKKQDDASAGLLRRMVFPFILRRTKDQVATDLPPRTEKILLAEMEPAQEKMYIKTRDRYRDELLGIISKEGMNNARMKILEALLRLRQISNHPKLMDAESTVDSGKFELLMETLETLRAEGHKALVFSQFVRMLAIVRDRLDAEGVPYQYLDGQTKDRQARVDAFQSDPNIPFFLISLKAGGVGLNLTSADYVVHIDPWWNPAVERQATDRTHRIGQEKPVFVYKLITRGTVEEKILDLQERKRQLVDQIVAGEESILKSLTRDDVAVLFS